MTITTAAEMEGMTRVGRLVGAVLRTMATAVEPGMSTAALDEIGAQFLSARGARSAPQLVYNFPGWTCISVNDEAVHGVPGERVIQPGDLVKIDVTAELDGYMADAALTVALPPVRREIARLEETARLAFQRALSTLRPGAPINGVGAAIQRTAERRGAQVLCELHSHGVGRTIHEEPRAIPQYRAPHLRGTFLRGQVVALEPILSTGTRWTRESPDGWTLRTADGSPAVHYEHTVVVTDDGPIILTAA